MDSSMETCLSFCTCSGLSTITPSFKTEMEYKLTLANSKSLIINAIPVNNITWNVITPACGAGQSLNPWEIAHNCRSSLWREEPENEASYGTTSFIFPHPSPSSNSLSPDRELEEALRTGQSDVAELREEFTHRVASLEKKLQTVVKVCDCKHTVQCHLCEYKWHPGSGILICSPGVTTSSISSLNFGGNWWC